MKVFAAVAAVLLMVGLSQGSGHFLRLFGRSTAQSCDGHQWVIPVVITLHNDLMLHYDVIIIVFWCIEIELYTEEHNFVNYWSKILQSLRGISKTGVTGVTVCENSHELWIVRFNFFNWHVKCNCHILLTLLLLVSWTWNNFVSAMSGSRVRSHLYQGVSYLSYVIE